jgi:hypothetical protein
MKKTAEAQNYWVPTSFAPQSRKVRKQEDLTQTLAARAGGLWKLQAM